MGVTTKINKYKKCTLCIYTQDELGITPKNKDLDFKKNKKFMMIFRPLLSI
jgi:hypothetical protein